MCCLAVPESKDPGLLVSGGERCGGPGGGGSGGGGRLGGGEVRNVRIRRGWVRGGGGGPASQGSLLGRGRGRE